MFHNISLRISKMKDSESVKPSIGELCHPVVGGDITENPGKDLRLAGI